MSKTWIGFLLAGLTAWCWNVRQRALRAKADGSASAAAPKEVATWEGEGGALPTSGRQAGMDPNLP